jgi:hypothetical protein
MDKVKLPRIKKSAPIDLKEYKAFLKFLPPFIRTLVETYKLASEVYAQIGLLYYWEEVFLLPADAVYRPERGLCMIFLHRRSSYGTNGEDGYDHYIPKGLAIKLLKLSQVNQGKLLFLQEDGSSFSHVRLNAEFRKASKKAMERNVIKNAITPLDLRDSPPDNIQFLPGQYPSSLFRDHRDALHEISKEQVNEITKIIPPSRRHSGRHREHSLQAILQVLLAQEEFGLSRSELMLYFPKLAQAAETQKRRWVEKGIWPHILRILKS